MSYEAIKKRLSNGHKLHMQHGADGREWWFECPRKMVDDYDATKAIREMRLVGFGDAFFNYPYAFQTYQLPSGGDH